MQWSLTGETSNKGLRVVLEPRPAAYPTELNRRPQFVFSVQKCNVWITVFISLLFYWPYFLIKLLSLVCVWFLFTSWFSRNDFSPLCFLVLVFVVICSYLLRVSLFHVPPLEVHSCFSVSLFQLWLLLVSCCLVVLNSFICVSKLLCSIPTTECV